MTTIGAVIVTYDSGEVVLGAVDALLAGERTPDRVVVVDNASTDPASLAALERLPTAVEVVRSPDNRGFCGGNNAGVAAVGPVDHVLLCNPDAFVTPPFLAGAVAHLDRHLEVGAVGPKLLQADDAGRPTGAIDSAGIVQTWFGRFVDRGQGRPDDGSFDGPPRVVPALCAAAALYRRQALDAVALPEGPFDERFFMYKEDVDLGLRLRAAGWRSVVRSDLVVHHQRGTAGADWHRAPAWARRRSLVNEWRVWRRGTLPPTRRAAMLPYLGVKTAITLVRR